ncbi:calcium-binding protein [Vreelandella alkaliphila]|uniref:Calcium-binding protein n=1 Tax=Vreelandella alkaliphila TaxID=272774 RepID=A0A7C9JS68_9GAMM|nr:calcium-binding protein [Halomonas alkaliphila]NDL70324.1 calcium-binding protein [Halomonas alkaliphila]
MAISSADILKSTQPGVMNGHLLNSVRVSSVGSQGDWQAFADTQEGVARIEIPADPQARLAFVRRWMAKNQKLLKRGGMASTLVLPLMAQQVLADDMVAINDLQGVDDVIRQPNGSLTLVMNNGQHIYLAAADVELEGGRVVVDITALMEKLDAGSGLLVPLSQLPNVQTWELMPDGNVMITRADGSQLLVERGAVVQQGDLLLISPSSALQQGVAESTDFATLLFVPSASFSSPSASGREVSTAGTSASSAPVSSFGEIPPWLYIGGGALALGAVAAGGGGGGGGGGSEPSTISGYVIDGYIAGATVTRAVNANQVETDNSGFFSGLQGSGILTATGGVDIATGLPFNGVLRAPEDATVITPLTTMMVQLSSQFDINDATSQSVIKTALGLDERVDLLTSDPLGEDSASVELLVAGVKVAGLLAMADSAGISSSDALSLLANALNQANEAGRELTNQQMADALGLPSIAGQVKQALDAIDKAGADVSLDAYREGDSNPLRDAQQAVQNPNSDLSNTIEVRADLAYLTLQTAVNLAQNGDLPSQYLINPGQAFSSGTLGLTVAADRLALVEKILAGDYDVDTAPIELSDIYTWSIRASVQDVLVTGGLERPAVLGAEQVLLTDETIRPDQFADLNTLDNFVLGSTVVPYTLEEALKTAEMPANYTLDPATPFVNNELSLREAAELIDETRLLTDRALNTGEDGLTREMLLNWTILDSFDNVMGASSADPQLNEARGISITEAVITPEQFKQLDALGSFELGATEVGYTLSEALEAAPLASNYIIDLDVPLNLGTVSVAQAASAFADVSRVLEGANNQPPLTLFQWAVSDSANAIIADINDGHIAGANPVTISDRAITVGEFDQLNTLENFQLGETVVGYTLAQAITADVLADNYEIAEQPPFNAGSVSVLEAEETLATVEDLLANAVNPQTPNADQLFNWIVFDTVDAILGAGDVAHLLRANAVNVSDGLITLAQHNALLELDSNYVRTGETVEYILSSAITADNNESLLNNYAINLEAIREAGEITVEEARDAYAQVVELVEKAENSAELLENLPFSWVVVDNANTIIGDIADDHVTLADQVRVTNAGINQSQYERLAMLENFELASAVVRYTLEGALNADIELADNYQIETEAYTPGSLSVADASSELARVEDIIKSANNADGLDAGELFNWVINDTAEAILAAGQDASHIVRADELRVTDRTISVGEYNALLAIESDNGGYQRGDEQVEYTLEQAFTMGDDDIVANYIISTGALFAPQPLTAQAAINDLAAVRQLLDNAENTPNLSNVYTWSVLDSYANIQAQLRANLPDGLQLADTVQVTTPTLTAGQYERLDTTLNNFSLGDTTAVTYVDISDALRAEEADLLAPEGRFSLLDDTTALVETLTVSESADTLANIRTVLEAANGLANDDQTVQTLFDWTVSDTADNVIRVINQGHITLAGNVVITDDQITYAQYQSLMALGNYQYTDDPIEVLYTLEEALELIDEEGIESLNKDPSDSSVGYRIADEELPVGTFTAADVKPLVDKALSALANANAPTPAVNALLKWTVVDTATALLEAQAGTEFPLHITGAEQVSVNNDILAIADLQRLQRLDNFELGDTPVRFILTSNLTLNQIESIANSYEITPNSGELPNFSLTTVADAQARYQSVQAIVDGALNSRDVSVEVLQMWSITGARADDLLAASDEAWVTGATTTSLELGADELLTAEQYEAFVALGNVTLDSIEVGYSLQDAVAVVDAGEMLPASTEERPGSYQVLADQPFDASSLTVAEGGQLLATVASIMADANNAAALDRETLLNWVVEDSVQQLMDAIDSDVLLAASSVRVNTDEIGYQDFEVLSELENFDQTGLTVSYPLADLVQRFISGGSIPENYSLDTNQSAFFDAGLLDVRAAEELFDTASTLLDGAVNNDVPLSSLTSWVVQDTYSNIYTLNVAGNGGVPADFLVDDAASIVVINDPLESDAEQDLNIAFTVNGYTHQPGAEAGGSVEQLSKTFTVDGQPDGSVMTITDFRVGDAPGADELRVGLTVEEFAALRGEGAGLVISEDVQTLDVNDAFAVFTTAEFENGVDWLDQLGLESGDVVYLLAGDGSTQEIADDALLQRVEALSNSAFNIDTLASFETINLGDFDNVNWNTNYNTIA